MKNNSISPIQQKAIDKAVLIAQQKLKQQLYKIECLFQRQLQALESKAEQKKGSATKKAIRVSTLWLSNQKKKILGKPVKEKAINWVIANDDLFSILIRTRFGSVCYTC